MKRLTRSRAWRRPAGVLALGLVVLVGLGFVGIVLVGPRVGPTDVGRLRHLSSASAGCFLYWEEGRVELGGPTGSQVVFADSSLMASLGIRSEPLLWPDGVGVRGIGPLQEIVGTDGVVLARNGQVAHLGGINADDGMFWVCTSMGMTFPK